jgi:hypothetical protein
MQKKKLEASSKILNSNDNDATKLRQLVKEIDKVILAADANKCIMILHSPKKFGGTRTRPENKVVWLVVIIAGSLFYATVTFGFFVVSKSTVP